MPHHHRLDFDRRNVLPAAAQRIFHPVHVSQILVAVQHTEVPGAKPLRVRVDRHARGIHVALAHHVWVARPARDLAHRPVRKRLAVRVDDSHLETGVRPTRRSGHPVVGHAFDRDREGLGQPVHGDDPAAVTLFDVAVHRRVDRRRGDEPQRQLRVARIRRLMHEHRDHRAGADETNGAAGAHLVPHRPRMKGRRQYRCPADKHRRQYCRRGAEVEQRHRRPQHLTRTELPGRRGRRGRSEQVVPRGGDRFRCARSCPR